MMEGRQGSRSRELAITGSSLVRGKGQIRGRCDSDNATASATTTANYVVALVETIRRPRCAPIGW